jgi:RNA polymerase sigma factor (sigma-70 family)
MLDRLNEIKAELTSEDVSIYSSIGGEEDGEEEGSFLETVEDIKSDNPAAVLFGKLDREEAGRRLSLLTERQKAIMVSRYVEEKTQQQVAEELGLSTGRVSQIEAEAREIMRRGWAA